MENIHASRLMPYMTPILLLCLLMYSFGCLGRAIGLERSELTVGASIYYGGYETSWFDCEGAIAYCANPQAPTPKSGSYPRSVLNPPSNRTQELLADLWFGYGSPGFDASLWPASWYDGSAMTPERYVALNHILLSDTYASSANYALHRCNARFCTWALYHVLGFNEDGSVSNEQATGRRIYARRNEVPANFEGIELNTGPTSQLVLSFIYTPHGSLELQKKSRYPHLSDAHSCYSLQGARYAVYDSADLGHEVASLVTDAQGYAKIEDIAAGTYWVKEQSAPLGMALDPEVYTLAVEPNECASVGAGEVYDSPQYAQPELFIVKHDTDLGPQAQGGGSLEGAEFSVRYYDLWASSMQELSAAGARPRAQWVFASNAEGKVFFSQSQLISGDPLYFAGDEQHPCLPLGTYVIQEIKAPQGYALDSNPRVIELRGNGATSEKVEFGAVCEISNHIYRGDYRLFKEVPTKEDPDDQDLTRIALSGIQFEIYNASTHSVLSPLTKKPVEPGGLVLTLTTNEDGFASTRDHKPHEWSGALAYGEYRIHERIPESIASRVKEEHNITMRAVKDWNIRISRDAQYDPVQLVANRLISTALALAKRDAETGRLIPLPCEFQIRDAQGNLVTYFDRLSNRSIDTWTTLESGRVQIPVMLSLGNYTLEEVRAPVGYALPPGPIAFEVTEGRDWDDPVEISVEDPPLKGEIRLTKTSSLNARHMLAQAVYVVEAAEDIITGDGSIRVAQGSEVGRLVTDEQGQASLGGLYMGVYVVRELKSPPGWLLDTREHRIRLSPNDREGDVPVVNLAVRDDPSWIEIEKRSSLTDEVLPGAQFELISAEGGLESQGASTHTVYTTDDQGRITLLGLRPGSYILREIKAPTGYFIDSKARVSFEVLDTGHIRCEEFGIHKDARATCILYNEPYELRIAKRDKETRGYLPGVTLRLTNSQGDLVDEWVTQGEPHVLRPIIPGDYILEEVKAPEGYVVDQQKATIRITTDTRLYEWEMINATTQVFISKKDAASLAELSGAKLELLKASGEIEAEWVSGDTPELFKGLPPGDYILREKEAPLGFDIASDMSFTVLPTEEPQNFEILNRRSPELPPIPIPLVGDVAGMILALLLFTGVLGGSIYACYRYHERNIREEKLLRQRFLRSRYLGRARHPGN